MNVVLVTPWPLGTPGGTQTLLRRVGEELVRLGFTVTAVTGERGLALVPCAIPEVRLPVVPAAPSRARVGSSTLDGLERAVEALRPDVVFYAPHHSHEAHQAAALAKALRARFAYWPLVHADRRSHTGREARAFAREADLVLCVTEGERRWLAATAGVVAPLLAGAGSDHAGEPLPPPRAGPRRALLTVGQLAPHKRHEDQLEALALLPDDLTLTIAGTAGEGEGRVRERIARLGLTHRVRLAIGPRPEELLALHREADVFLFTSRSESLGVALLDAVCLGTLPVAYPHPVYGGLVASSGFGVLAEAESPRALAEAVLRARATPRTTAPGAAFRSAHTWPAVAGRIADALTGLVAAARGDGRRWTESSPTVDRKRNQGAT